LVPKIHPRFTNLPSNCDAEYKVTLTALWRVALVSQKDGIENPVKLV
jgi:hypothetical protein